jgi:translation initiation factor IF-3
VSNQKKRKQEEILKNEAIRFPVVHLVTEQGMERDINTYQALQRAKEDGLDLVVVSEPKGNELAVCKIFDYYKNVYVEKKAKKPAPKHQVKEIKFRVNTDQGDIDTKIRKITEFLSDQCEVRLSIRMRGRENAHAEIGKALLGKVTHQLAENDVSFKFKQTILRNANMISATLEAA